LTVSIYLAHLNPVTNAHVEIIDELKKESDVIVMPVIFRKNDEEVNSRSFPFSFEIRKQMLDEAFGDSIKVSKNYTFRAPFWRYLPPLLSPFSWILRNQILEGIPEDYFTYTGDKAEGRMLKGYRLNPKIGIRKTVSATSVKNKMYDTVLGKNTTWEEDVPPKVVEIIKQHWEVVEKYAKLEDETTRVVGMKFPKDGYWSR
jgi:nicotinamide mononucleotide adenylyltransferase